ncbi:MAG: bifunctional diaminohydroxyphosphoribosylaminopyrimidine deaminase/5-amino-6-(5-phosphoribosylamino)uracil reductase RibD [Bacteroidia bacterium]
MNDEYFMQRAIELAEKGKGYVQPNPMVGCVIVRDNEILAEGYHEYYGGPHAEVNAIKMLENKGFREWDKVTLYVTLEPCSHFGKTPPCTNLILDKGIKQVVVATVDVNPLVAGSGIKKLKENGVLVKTGILEVDAKKLNKRFFTYHQQKRPYTILKWAETKDGFISKKYFSSREENVISSLKTLQLVHQWRSEEQSIMAGYNTVVKDNPQLNVRYVKGKNPIKVITDKYLSLNAEKYNVFKGSEKVIVFNQLKNEAKDNVEYVKINFDDFVNEVLNYLYRQNIISVLVEGGSKTLQYFLNAGVFDEIRILRSRTKTFGDGIQSPVLPENIRIVRHFSSDEDEVLMYYSSENIFQ